MQLKDFSQTPLFLLFVLCLGLGPSYAQTIDPFYSSDYSAVSIGSVPGVPTNYGGLTFLDGDPNTILIGGAANGAAGALYSIGVIRDGDDHITGFSGTAVSYSTAPNVDGGVTYGPDDIIFFSGYSQNTVSQIMPGSVAPDKVVSVGPLGVTSSLGALNFVPSGVPGAGQLKVASYPSGNWYTLTISPDGLGTFDITAATPGPTITGGPEGIVYVPSLSPLFTAPSVLISEYQGGGVASYEVDANGDPIVATRRPFITGLTGAEGATIDPVSGDFLFSTFGGGNQVVVVRGFGVLPVEMTSFSAITGEEGIRLDWETASEVNNAGFYIERQRALATNGVWESLGFVEGQGASLESNSYSYVTSKPEPGTWMFRLKQVDFDGSFEYSETVEVSVAVPDQFVLYSAYPNPFNPSTTVRFAVALEQEVTLTLFDSHGREIRRLFSGLLGGNDTQTIKIDAGGLSSGNYLVRLEGAEFSRSEVLTLLR